MTSFQVNGNTVITSDRIVQLTSGASGSRPASPAVGMMFFNTSSGKLEVWNGNAWKENGVVAQELPSLWGWGSNGYGQLGDGVPATNLSPKVGWFGFTDWIQVSRNRRHAVALRPNGQAWASGSNTYGQLGNGNTTNASSPVSVLGGISDWTQLSAGVYHSAGVRANGQVWSWGRNNQGQLGVGNLTNTSSPASVVGGFTDWVQVTTGKQHTVALRANGTAWSWGYNSSGELGTGNNTRQSSPVSVVGGITNWVQLSTTYGHTLGVRADGTAWAWGVGLRGVLGDGTASGRSSPVAVAGGFTDWVQVSAGRNHSTGIRANGTAWAWGYNSSTGFLGVNSTASSILSPASVVGGFTDWVQLSSGFDVFTVGVRANGTAWSWGAGSNYRLGVGDNLDRVSPTSVIGGISDWVQVRAGANDVLAIRSQPRTQTVRPTNQRNTF